MPSATKQRTKPKAKPKTKPSAPKRAADKAKVKREVASLTPKEVVGGTVRPSKAAKKGSKNGLKKAPAPRFTAANADRYDLYQRSVNSPDADVDFLLKVYSHFRKGRRPRHLREDFCGTANLAAEWLRRGRDFTAEGFDLDPEPIAWGKRINFAGIAKVEDRMTFHLADVRSRANVAPDIATAPNFSYWCMRTRAELIGYFRSAYEGLAKEGLFVIDVYGGPESIVEMEELRDIDGKFTYVWDQQLYWPGTGEYHAAIHFRFQDGSELKDAFHYVWRFWHLTELKDMLAEVGFKSVTTWFEGTDPKDEEAGNGVFELDEKGENCQAWIGYVVAAK